MRMPWIVGFLLAVLAAGSRTTTAAEFYAGKRLIILVNYDAGGPTDLEARLLARHLVKHIPGAPPIIVQNMGGAAGLTGTKYIGEIAPRDGSMMGYLTAAPHRFAFNPEKFAVDFRTYEFIAYTPNGRVHFMRRDVKPGINRPTDLVKAEGVVAGGLGAEAVKDLAMRLILDILGVKHKYVTGYNSSAQAMLALQRGEINYLIDSPSLYFAKVEPLVKSGEMIPVLIEPGYDGTSFVVPKQLRGLDVPLLHDFYRSAKGVAPSGQLWDSYLALLTVSSSLYRVIAMPPGAPKEAVAMLRAAMLKLNEDKDYQDEAQRTINEAPEYVANPDINEEVRKGVSVRPEVRTFIDEYVKKGSRR